MEQQLQTFPCQFTDLGLIGYSKAFLLQKKAVEGVISGDAQTVFLCEHPPVFTLGRLASEENFLTSKETIIKQGIQILNIDRGGEVTLHSPGQLVVYPVFDLQHYGKDLKGFLHQLEQVAIDLLRDFGIVADRIPGQRGVWVGGKKIASIGIGVKKWVSYHGMSINLNTDLQYFSMIKPCGLDVEMTSVARITGSKVAPDQAKKGIENHFCRIFHLTNINTTI